MSGFITGEFRTQATLFPKQLDDYASEDNATRVIDVFIDGIDLSAMGFKTTSAATGRPGYHSESMLKLYVHGYLNRIQSSHRLEREAGRNVELMWLLGRLAPDFKTIADFRKDNTQAIKLVCREFVIICRKLNLFSELNVDKLTAVADRGYYSGEEIKSCGEANIEVYLPKSETSNNQAKGLFGKRDFIYKPEDDEYECPAGERAIFRYISQERGKSIRRYWYSACVNCKMKPQCTTGVQRRISRWEHEAVLDDLENRLNQAPEMMKARRETVEHPFGTLKLWMGYTHFQMRTLERGNTEINGHKTRT